MRGRGTRILVGTAAGLYEVPAGNGPAFAGREVTALARDDAGCWAIVGEGEIWHLGAGGEWAAVAQVPRPYQRATCLLPTPMGLLVGTEGAHLLSLLEGRLQLVETFEAVEGRESWYTPWGGPPDTRSLALGPDGAVYVNVHVGGVLRSQDGGRSWRPTIDINADVHQVVAHPRAAGLVLAASARGLAVSQDGGERWQFLKEGLHGQYLRAVAVTEDDTVLVTASTGPYTQRAAVYRRPLAGEGPFQKCDSGLPEWFGDNIDTYCLAAAGPLTAFGTVEGEVFLSADGGRRWETAASGLPRVCCLLID